MADSNELKKVIPMAKEPKIKRLTARILMGLVATILMITGIASFNIEISGKASEYFLPVLTIGMGAALFTEGMRKEYLIASTYKQLKGNQFIGLLSVLIGGITIMAGITLIPIALFAGLPMGLLTFITNIAGVVNVVGAILALIQIFVV